MCKVNQLNELTTDKLNYLYFFNEMSYYKSMYPEPSEEWKSLLPNTTAEAYNEFWERYTSTDGYYPILPFDVKYAESKEAKENPFALHCRASEWDETPSWDCSSAISSVWNPQYYRCSSIKIPDEKRQVISSILFIIYYRLIHPKLIRTNQFLYFI